MVLICYEGSADAQAAIDRARQLMPGSDVTVLVICETILETMTRNGSLGLGLGLIGDYGDDDTDAASENAALDTATDGAHRAAGTRRAVADRQSARRHRRGDPGRGGRCGRRCHRSRNARPQRSQVADARQRFACGAASRRPVRPGRSILGSRRAASPLGQAPPDHGRRHMTCRVELRWPTGPSLSRRPSGLAAFKVPASQLRRPKEAGASTKAADDLPTPPILLTASTNGELIPL